MLSYYDMYKKYFLFIIGIFLTGLILAGALCIKQKINKKALFNIPNKLVSLHHASVKEIAKKYNEKYLNTPAFIRDENVINKLSVTRGIKYGSNKYKNLEIDLYQPKDNKNILPLVIFIHGGGWAGGNHEECPADKIVPHNYIVACINYSFSGEEKFPRQIYDIKAAVRWLRANAEKYNIDKDNFGVWGESAGGHLASLLGVSGDVEALEGGLGEYSGYSSRVNGYPSFIRCNA